MEKIVGEETHFGLTGKIAVTVYENFEVILMFILAFVLGGVSAPILLYSASFSTSILFITGITVLLGLTLVASAILPEQKRRYEL